MAEKLSPDDRIHVLAVEYFKDRGASLENSRYIVAAEIPQILYVPHKLFYRRMNSACLQLEDLIPEQTPRVDVVPGTEIQEGIYCYPVGYTNDNGLDLLVFWPRFIRLV